MTIDIEAAARYVRQYGDAIEQARLAYLFDGKPVSQEVYAELANLQNPDGGWPYGHEEHGLSCLAATHFALSWLDDLGLRDDPLYTRSLEFLRTTQGPDGSWRESEKLAALNPPVFMSPTNEHATVYLTADSAYHLAIVPVIGPRAEAVRQACAYMRPFTDDWEEQYLHTVWLAGAAFALSEPDGWHNDSAASALQYLALELSEYPDAWTATMLAWMLDVLITAGVDRSVPVVQWGLLRLEALQQEDGGFNREEGDPFVVDATIQTLRVLKAVAL
jgi:hypothetical protein